MRAAILVLSLAFAASGCTKNNSDTTSTTPSTPRTTDTLTGTVQVKGSDSKTFTVTLSGLVDVTLTAAGPPATIAMSVAVGTTTSGCTAIAGSSALLSAGGSLPTGLFSPGTYCVLVSDNGSQTGAITYTATVTHP